MEKEIITRYISQIEILSKILKDLEFGTELYTDTLAEYLILKEVVVKKLNMII
jgi:hypothetical protein